MTGVSYNRDNKFDIQLSQALIEERRLGEIFRTQTVVLIEHKGERHQWEQTGNIAIEFACRGKKSGIAVTWAQWWVHELIRDGETLVYLMFPIERLKQLCRDAYRRGDWRDKAGDDKQSSVVLLKLRDILK